MGFGELWHHHSVIDFVQILQRITGLGVGLIGTAIREARTNLELQDLPQPVQKPRKSNQPPDGEWVLSSDTRFGPSIYAVA